MNPSTKREELRKKYESNFERVLDRIDIIKMDERLYYPSATIFANAPLAIIQIDLTVELNTLERMVGLEPSKMPLKGKPKKS